MSKGYQKKGMIDLTHETINFVQEEGADARGYE